MEPRRHAGALPDGAAAGAPVRWAAILGSKSGPMSASKTLPDLLQRTHEVRGEEVFYRFSNGLTIKTEVLSKNDRLRILSLGTPQGSLMNHMLNFPTTVRDKRVFEPFAGSGALGFMALKAGARHVDFLDINPRAADFQRENAALNQFSSGQFTAITADVADFAPGRKYDLILANPPFVPTPEGIEGTMTSNGGPEGSRFVAILLERLEAFLEPGGRALIYVFQFAKDARPLIVELLARTSKRRPGRTHAGTGAADSVRDLLQGVPSAIPDSQSSHRALAVRPAPATRQRPGSLPLRRRHRWRVGWSQRLRHPGELPGEVRRELLRTLRERG